MTIKLKDSFEGIKEFKPLSQNEVKIYSCGPTVYKYVSIGNLRSFLFSDILKKSLEYVGFKISDVMNITDVGHLTTDGDEGEDKLEKEAILNKFSVMELAEFYTNDFYKNIEKLNIRFPKIISKASDNIDTQLEMIDILDSKGYVYKTSTGVYFDTSKYIGYEKLINQKGIDQKKYAREGVKKDKTKKNPQDFRLWQTSYPNHILQWDSKWGRGFPGWHIECSAIIYKFLGKEIDIHTGGIDLKSLHHVNEIAQSKAAFDSKFVNYWMHNEFVLSDGVKMSKSLNNAYLLSDLEKEGIPAIYLRYLYLNAHYSSLINFTFESLRSAQNALDKIYNFIRLNIDSYDPSSLVNDHYKKLFIGKIENDIDTPGMLEVLWAVVKDNNISSSERISTILDFDKVLSLNFLDCFNEKIPKEVLSLADDRSKLRNNQDWKSSDEIREKINLLGYSIIDLRDKYFLVKNKNA